MLTQLRLLFSMALTLLLLPAAARVTIPADTTKEVVLYLVTDSIPGGAIVLGDFKIGDNGFTSDCQYQRVIEKAKQKAAKAGGNAIKITELKEPDIWSSCYRIKGKILQIDAEAYAEKVVQSNTYINDDEDDVATDASAGYALLYLYRPKNFSGSAIGYDIYLDDSVICRMTNNSKYEIKVYKPGQHKIWAKTEAKAIVPLNIKPGKSYYIKCGIQTGFWVGQPQLNLVYPTQGKEEYEQMKGRGEKKK